MVERQALSHPDRKGEGYNLQKQGAIVAGSNFVKTVAAVSDDSSKHVQPAGGTLRVGLAADVWRQAERFHNRNQIGPVCVEDGAFLPEVDLVDDQVLDLALYHVAIGEKAATDTPGELAKTQIYAGRLDILGRNPVVAGVNVAGLDCLRKQLAW